MANHIIHMKSMRLMSRSFSLTCHVAKKTNPSLPNLATTEEATKKTEIKRKIFWRMFDYVEHYGETVLSKVLPSVAFNAIKTFSKGTKALLGDMKDYAWVNHELSESRNWQKACRFLSRRQLEIYLYLPGELMRVTPVLVISAFPLAQNVVFPLAMMFPKRLLSSHFYSPQVQIEAFHDESKFRHAHYRALFRHLTTSLTGQSLTAVMSDAIPNPFSVLNLKSHFSSDGLMHLNKLSSPHIKHLMKGHSVRGSMLWFPRFRLQQYANLVHQIDLAILREGGAEALSLKDLRRACHLRGLNVKDQDEDVLHQYLRHWIAVTSKLDSDSMSLLLHLPVLLGYNHTSRIWDKWSVH